MSASEVEIVLARLFTDPSFMRRFLENPETALKDHDLTEFEKTSLKAIDRAGLIMASQSYARKREKRGPKRTVVSSAIQTFRKLFGAKN